MSELHDSGKRREVSTGAVRDISEGKGRCDLLPLYEISVLFSKMDLPIEAKIMENFFLFLRSGNTDFLYDILKDFIGGSPKNKEKRIAHDMLELAIHFEMGAKKYGDRNWEKGIPLSWCIDSGLRHYFKMTRGDKDEFHNRAFIWNVICAIWTVNNRPEMIDIEFKGEERNE